MSTDTARLREVETDPVRVAREAALWDALKRQCCSTRPDNPRFDEVSTIVSLRRSDLATAMRDAERDRLASAAPVARGEVTEAMVDGALQEAGSAWGDHLQSRWIKRKLMRAALEAALAAAMPHRQDAGEVERLTYVKTVAEAMQGGGFWNTCSGCHESDGGLDIGFYPFSPVYRCKVGAGCSECGGIGVVWNEAIDERAEAALASRPEHAESAWRFCIKMRQDGWSVAVHNDYRIAGEPYTFWLFTHPDGRYVRGEGRSDEDALRSCHDAAYPPLAQPERAATAGESAS